MGALPPQITSYKSWTFLELINHLKSSNVALLWSEKPVETQALSIGYMSNVLALISETPTKNQIIQFLTCNAANSKFPFMKNFINVTMQPSLFLTFSKFFIR